MEKTPEPPFFSDPRALREALWHLCNAREAGKIGANRKRTGALSPEARQRILKKTDHRCHVCGIEIPNAAYFEADHVMNHSSGGTSNEENFLASCPTCNGSRWHYAPEELHWILKIGGFAVDQIRKATDAGTAIAEAFVRKEVARERRRKNPRKPESEQDGGGQPATRPHSK